MMIGFADFSICRYLISSVWLFMNFGGCFYIYNFI